jgi:hypothetical protein
MLVNIGLSTRFLVIDLSRYYRYKSKINYDIILSSIAKNLVLRPIFTNIYDIILSNITKNLVLRPIFNNIYA